MVDLKGNYPKILMKGRHKPKLEHLDPAYFKVPATLGKVPKIHMHCKSDLTNKFHPPGPNYIPPRFGVDGHKIGFARHSSGSPAGADDQAGSTLGRRRNPNDTPGPGPGKYLTLLR
jgi:hypothetical protein